MGVDACMLLKYNGDLSDDEILSMAVNAKERFGEALFVFEGYGEQKEGAHHCLYRVTEYNQEGDTIIPEAGETFIEVCLWGRYYGEGYARGNLPDYIMIAEYFENILPGVTIYYGGDSYGFGATPFDKSERARMFDYFCKVGHRPYQEAFDCEKDGHICDMCKTRVIRCGWGGNWAKWFCPGCGRSWELRDGKIVKSDTD